jgi:hypothetical protein
MDDYQWTAYAFEDSIVYEDVPNESDYDEDYPKDEDYPEVITTCRGITDPRQYFLRSVKLRSVQILVEWDYAIRRIQRAVREYVRHLPALQ